MTGWSFAAPDAPDAKVYRLTVEAPDEGGLEGDVNLYLLGGGGGLLVDSGFVRAGSGMLREALGEVGMPATAVLTHAHLDHAGGVAELLAAGVRVLAHRCEAPLLARAGLPATLATLEDGDVIDAQGAVELRAIHTPGHTPGHVCYLAPASGLLFTGDLVLMRSTTWVGPPHGDMGDYLRSLERLLATPGLRRLLPGHGPAGEAPYERIRAVLLHRLEREEQVLAGLRRAPATARELAQEIYAAEIPPELLPLAALTVEGHLALLLRQGRVRRGPLGALGEPRWEAAGAP